ncbi:MAG TPA: hypothetical protein VFH08_00455 [Chitinophagaceae bacterium]|nr:hypothetical protein [Chitinophagaceae bacterium]
MNILKFGLIPSLLLIISFAKGQIKVREAIVSNGLSVEWKEALKTRMSEESIDSFGAIKRSLTVDELAWKRLIESKAALWNSWRDSLAVPFKNIEIHDTVFVLLGFLGVDDGFTFGSRTVCIDLTALQRAYGNADLRENYSRIDRIVAHEYTHLLHKKWAKEKKYQPLTFKDSILWECLYEGVGMYRSLNAKWLPVNDTLPMITTTALEKLYPVFVDRITTVVRNPALSNEEKVRLNANLSRGTVDKKWGAFPVAIWLLLEARGDEKELIPWINKGPEAVLKLADKYLPAIVRKDWDRSVKK